MNQAQLRHPEELSKVALSLIATASNAVQTGAVIDRTGYTSIFADVIFATSGTPTGGTITLQLQDSADGTTFANYGTAVTVNVATAPAGAVASLAMDLNGARQYVRLQTTGAPTGGSSPVVTASHTIRLNGPDRWPAI